MENMQSSETTHHALWLLYFLLKYLLYNQCNKHNAGSPILFQPNISQWGKENLQSFMSALLSDIEYISAFKGIPTAIPFMRYIFKKDVYKFSTKWLQVFKLLKLPSFQRSAEWEDRSPLPKGLN